MTDRPAPILVVEDDDATRTFLADNLTADGYDVLVADSARDGLRLFREQLPPTILRGSAVAWTRPSRWSIRGCPTGSRLMVIPPLAVDGSALTIRRFRPRGF